MAEKDNTQKYLKWINKANQTGDQENSQVFDNSISEAFEDKEIALMMRQKGLVMNQQLIEKAKELKRKNASAVEYFLEDNNAVKKTKTLKEKKQSDEVYDENVIIDNFLKSESVGRFLNDFILRNDALLEKIIDKVLKNIEIKITSR